MLNAGLLPVDPPMLNRLPPVWFCAGVEALGAAVAGVDWVPLLAEPPRPPNKPPEGLLAALPPPPSEKGLDVEVVPEADGAEAWLLKEKPPVELAGGGPAGVVEPAKENEGFAGVVEGPEPGVVVPVLNGELLPPPKRPVPLLVPLPLPPPAAAPPKSDGWDAPEEAGAPPNKLVAELLVVPDDPWPVLAPKRPPPLAPGLLPVLFPNTLLPEVLVFAPPKMDPELAPPKLNFGASLEASLDMLD